MRCLNDMFMLLVSILFFSNSEELAIRLLYYRMWLVNWFKSTLESLGLMNKKAKIVFLGLDDAGKTTLLLRLKEDVMKQMDPTQQPYSE